MHAEVSGTDSICCARPADTRRAGAPGPTALAAAHSVRELCGEVHSRRMVAGTPAVRRDGTGAAQQPAVAAAVASVVAHATARSSSRASRPSAGNQQNGSRRGGRPARFDASAPLLAATVGAGGGPPAG